MQKEVIQSESHIRDFRGTSNDMPCVAISKTSVECDLDMALLWQTLQIKF
jgi:hypothetical protein